MQRRTTVVGQCAIAQQCLTKRPIFMSAVKIGSHMNSQQAQYSRNHGGAAMHGTEYDKGALRFNRIQLVNPPTGLFFG